jgi:RNA polymerase sigma factor (sigma-70 family)
MGSDVMDADAMDSDLFSRHLPLIESVIKFVVVRHGLRADEAEEFAGIVRLRLLDHDCAVFRKFEGRCTMRTFLTVVVLRLFQDYRTAQWGKWRASAEARRLGPLAIHLERLMSRDGLSFDEAAETLRTNHGVTEDDGSLRALASRIVTTRARRRLLGEDELEQLTAESAPPSQPLLQAQADQAFEALRHAMKSMSPEELRVLRLIFVHRLGIAQTARRCGLDQKVAYRRVAALLKRLRAEVQKAGITHLDVAAWIGRADVDTSHVSILRPLGEHE